MDVNQLENKRDSLGSSEKGAKERNGANPRRELPEREFEPELLSLSSNFLSSLLLLVLL